MTASPPKVNGAARPPALKVLGDWQPIEATPTTETDNRASQPSAASVEPQADSELVAQAKAEAIRAQAWAESEERRLAAEAEKEAALLRAEAEAEAIRTKAEEEARKQRIANDKAEARAQEEQAAREARIAKLNRERDEEDRAREDARRQAEEQAKNDQVEAEKIEQAEDSWRFFAIAFAVMCGIVALPVQMAAFWNEKAPWMISAPFMLEGAAWVVLRGAAAAVAAKRPHWHFRLIAWLLAFVAAAVNLWHGLNAFDPATAIGTAVASIAGPGVWDLHEHGRIRKRDGVPTRRERKAAEKEAKRLAAEQAADEARRRAEKEAADKAAAEKLAQLTELRKTHFQKVWEHAEKLAADLGEVDPNAVWERAKLDVDGAKPGESAEVIRMRNVAATRVESARQNRPVNTVSKTTNAQRAIQTPRSSYKPVPPRRTKGDTPRYTPAAGRAHGELLRRQNAAKNTRPNDN